MTSMAVTAEPGKQDRTEPFLIGDWLVDPGLNALSREGLEQRVEPKVMKVLLTLAADPQHVIPKEKLISAVWSDTFVSDDVLTRCISILRRITGDDAHAPRYIQTVPRVGYRLVAPVRDLVAEKTPVPSYAVPMPVPLVPLEVPETLPAPVPAQVTAPRRRFAGVRAIAAGVAALACLIWGVIQFRPRHSPERTFRTLPFTFAAGEQVQPVFAPGGRRVAFVEIPEEGGSRRIYIKDVGGDASFPLTPQSDQDAGGRSHSSEEQFSPAWSPDERSVAYLALTASGPGLFLASAEAAGTGKPAARQLYTLQEPSHWEQGALSWSPDGRYLIFPDHIGSSPNSSILQLELATSHVQPLTAPPTGWEGDLTPAYSPDGRRIAFTRASETAVRDIFWISLPDRGLHQLTHDRMNIDSLAWSADGKSIVFSSNRGGKFALWSMALNGKEPERLPIGTEDAVEPSVGSQPGQLAYAQGSAIWSIARVGGSPGASVPVLSSTQQDSAPSLSPDGGRFAIQSLRSGSQQIWAASLDGRHMQQITSMAGPLTGSPAWSNRGDRILFDSRPDGHSHIFVVAASGGKPRQLTFGAANDIVPRWSHDDQAVYFRSNRGGRWQLWRLNAAGGEPQPVTLGDGMEPQESADGRWLYYTRGDADGIWRSSIGPGTREQIQDEPVLDQPSANYWGYWQLTPRGIDYLDLKHGQAAIRFFDFATKGRSTVAPLAAPPPVYAGLSATNNGSTVLLTEEREAGRHITLVEAEH